MEKPKKKPITYKSNPNLKIQYCKNSEQESILKKLYSVIFS